MSLRFICIKGLADIVLNVAFVTRKADGIELKPGTVQLGICMDTPPVFGRMCNLYLAEENKDCS